jgi:hypothetical protein
MILVVCLLAVIAFRPATQPQYSLPVIGQTSLPHRSDGANPAYKVFEVEPDANKINDILTKNANEGAFGLAVAPFYKPGSNAKIILILVQHL